MLLRTLGIFLVVITAFHSVFGCMCGATSICDAYATANAVVIAEVTNIKPKNIALDKIFVDGDAGKFESGQEVSLKISKWFKGPGQKTLKITQANSTCDWNFDQSNFGEKFLFYLSYNKKYDTYSIISCGRSSVVSNAVDDISWLNGLPQSLKRTRISGVTKVSSETFSPLENVNISIKGKTNSFDLTTDKSGLYQKWDVLPGKYRITSHNPPNLALAWTTTVPENWIYFWSFKDADLKALDVTIEPGKCGGIDFMFENK